MNLKYLDKHSWKYRHSLFDFKQLQKICGVALEEERIEWQKNHDLWATLTVATVLNAPPFNFGKKRLTQFFTLLFNQAAWLSENPDDLHLCPETVEKIGLKFKYVKGRIQIHEEVKKLKGAKTNDKTINQLDDKQSQIG